jgi:hypothetical protein
MTKSIAIAVLTQLICRTSGASDVAWDVHIMPVDLRGDASPLVSTTLLCPRRSRAGYAECPRYWQRSCPRPQTVRGRGLAAYRQWPRTVRVLVQPMSSFSPCPRTVHGHVMATGKARTWTVKSLVQSTDLDRPCPRSVRDLVRFTDYKCPRTIHVPDHEWTWTVHRQVSQWA